jgi:cellulose synthase/poly-beta-1,6-N-acetylglucosamine synthase-like glycosyltransferase
MAITESDVDVYAFIDSDAYPVRDWLKNALRHFSDPDVAAVVGPSLTPDDDDLMAKASGLVVASPLGGGSESIRYSQSHSHIRYVTEAPTCNLIIRKSVLTSVKDLVPDVWPGEEIVLCGAVTKDLKKRIVYDPQVMVYHHRRKLFIPHLKQIWKYGAVKGYLLKKYPQYVRPVFFLPSLLVLGIVGGLPLAILNPVIGYAYISLLLAYFSLSLVNSIFTGLRERSIKVALLILAGTIATHICYGLAFIKGIFS